MAAQKIQDNLAFIKSLKLIPFAPEVEGTVSGGLLFANILPTEKSTQTQKREDIEFSFLFAQLYANREVGEPGSPGFDATKWLGKVLELLGRVGWTHDALKVDDVKHDKGSFVLSTASIAELAKHLSAEGNREIAVAAWALHRDENKKALQLLQHFGGGRGAATYLIGYATYTTDGASHLHLSFFDFKAAIISIQIFPPPPELKQWFFSSYDWTSVTEFKTAFLNLTLDEKLYAEYYRAAVLDILGKHADNDTSPVFTGPFK